MWGQLQRGENVSLDDGQVLTSDDFVNIQQTHCKLAGDNDTPDLLTDTVQAATVWYMRLPLLMTCWRKF